MTINLTKCDDPIDAAGVCIGVDLSYNDEIGLALQSPAGTIVPLVNPDDLSGQTPGATVTWTFDDAASSFVSGDSLVSGTYKPRSPLSAFNGENGNGLWQLIFTDTVDLDPMSINSWSLTVNPAPAPLPILGVAAAFGSIRKANKFSSLMKTLPKA